MSLFDYLERVRQKPEAERRRLLIIWTVSGTLLIIFLWLINIFLLKPNADWSEVVVQQEKFGVVRQDMGEALNRIYLGFDLIADKFQNLFR